MAISMICILNTETSGFLTPNYPPDHSHQGRILQLGAMLIDEELNEQASFNVLIKQSESLIIHPSAFATNNLTIEQCNKYGVPIELAILMLDVFLKNSDYHVGFNIKFDIKMLQYEDSITFGSNRLVFKNPLCIMDVTTPICKLPRPNRSDYKWPKLSEAYFHFFGKLPEKSHSALDNCRSSLSIMKELLNNNHISLMPNNVIPIS